MNPALKDKLLRPRWIRWLARHIFATGDTIRRAVQKPIIDAYVPSSGGRVADVGAGRGMYTLETLVPRFQRVVSIELRPDHLAYLADQKRRYGYSNLWIVRASAEHLPFKDEVFDTALCTEVIEHLKDDQAGIAELERILRQNGNLVLSVPVPPAPRYDGAHVHEGYTYPQLRALLHTQHMSIEAKDYCLLLITRGVLHVIAFFEGRLKIPPPIVILCYLERWLLRYRKASLKPYDIVVNVRKKEPLHVEHVVTTG